MEDEMFRDFDGSLDLFAVGFFVAFAAVALLILTGILTMIYKGLAQRSRDNASSLLTVPAVVLAKRQEVRRGENSSSNSYYVTFELQGHDRLEFPVLGQQWGTLLEGDRGRVTYQGSRFKGFDRTPQDH